MISKRLVRKTILAGLAFSLVVILPFGYYDGVVAAKAKAHRHIVMFSAVLAEEFASEAGDLAREASGEEGRWRVSWRDASVQHVDLLNSLLIALDDSNISLQHDLFSSRVQGVTRAETIPELVQQLQTAQQDPNADEANVRLVMGRLASRMKDAAEALRGQYAINSLDRSYLYRFERRPIVECRKIATEKVKQLNSAVKRLRELVEQESIRFANAAVRDAAVSQAVECCRISRAAYVHLFAIAEVGGRYSSLRDEFVIQEIEAGRLTDLLVQKLEAAGDLDASLISSLKKYSVSMSRRVLNLPAVSPVFGNGAT